MFVLFIMSRCNHLYKNIETSCYKLIQIISIFICFTTIKKTVIQHIQSLTFVGADACVCVVILCKEQTETQLSDY